MILLRVRIPTQDDRPIRLIVTDFEAIFGITGRVVGIRVHDRRHLTQPIAIFSFYPA